MLALWPDQHEFKSISTCTRAKWVEILSLLDSQRNHTGPDTWEPTLAQGHPNGVLQSQDSKLGPACSGIITFSVLYTRLSLLDYPSPKPWGNSSSPNPRQVAETWGSSWEPERGLCPWDTRSRFRRSQKPAAFTARPQVLGLGCWRGIQSKQSRAWKQTLWSITPSCQRDRTELAGREGRF